MESPNLEFSTSFWIKPTARNDLFPGGATDTNVIMGANSGGGVIELVGQGSWGGMGGAGVYGGAGVNSGGGAGSTGKVSAVDVYDGGWHHVLIQWVDPDGSIAGGTGGPATVYIDGALADVTSGNYIGNGGAAPTMVLGGPVVGSNGGPPNDYYQGLMSDVIFFNRQLTANEVPEAMALSAQVPEPSTLVLAALGLISLGLGTQRRRRRA